MDQKIIDKTLKPRLPLKGIFLIIGLFATFAFFFIPALIGASGPGDKILSKPAE